MNAPVTIDTANAAPVGILGPSLYSGRGRSVKRTMDANLWREIRWRVALQLLLWGTKAAPDSEARDDLISIQLEWIERWPFRPLLPEGTADAE